MELRTRASALIEELNGKLIERDEIIRILLLTMFSKKHPFLIGTPGTGKTYLIKLIVNSFTPKSFWTLLFTHETKKEEVYGRPVYDETGNAIYDKVHTILGARIAFFDEMFKATSELLNSFLELLAERSFTEKGESINLPLSTVIGASNELPVGDLILPFVDRFIVFLDVPRIQKEENLKKYLIGDFDRNPNIENTFTFQEVDTIQKLSKNIIISDQMLRLFILTLSNINKSNVNSDGSISGEVSDRKYGYIIEALKCAAVVNEHTEIDESYMLLLVHMTWTTYREKNQVKDVIYKTIFSDSKTIESVISAISNASDEIAGIISQQSKYIKYKQQFKQDRNYSGFDALYSEVEVIHNRIREIIDSIEALNQRKAYNEDIIKKTRDNLFLPDDINPKIFTNELLETISSYEFDYNIINKEYTNWLENSKTQIQYNNKCGVM